MKSDVENKRPTPEQMQDALNKTNLRTRMRIFRAFLPVYLLYWEFVPVTSIVSTIVFGRYPRPWTRRFDAFLARWIRFLRVQAHARRVDKK